MKRHLTMITIACLMLTGCQEASNEVYIPKESVVIHQTEDVQIRFEELRVLEKTDKYSISVTYPIFTNKDNLSIITMLNDDIKKIVDDHLADIREANTEEIVHPYLLEITPSIYRLDDDIISMTLNVYTYFGGAHPNHYSTAFNVSLTDNTYLTLDGLLQGESSAKEVLMPQLKEKIEARDVEGMHPWLDDLDNLSNFVLKSDELLLFFNPYEIGPYAEGSSDYSFTFNEIRHLLEPDQSIFEANDPEYFIQSFAYEENPNYNVPLVSLPNDKDLQAKVNKDILDLLSSTITVDTTRIYHTIRWKNSDILSIEMYFVNKADSLADSVIMKGLSWDVNNSFSRIPLNSLLTDEMMVDYEVMVNEAFKYHYLYSDNVPLTIDKDTPFSLSPGYIHFSFTHEGYHPFTLEVPLTIKK